MATVFDDDVVFNGSINAANATTMTHKAASVTNGDIQAAAGIDYDKLDHLVEIPVTFGFASGDTPTTKTVPVAVVGGTGTIRYVKAWLKDTGSSTNISFDLHKGAAGGASSTVLSAAIPLQNTDADATPKNGTLSSSSLADEDYLEAVMTVTSSTGATGPMMVIGYSYEGTPS